ncbi:MAG: hypothetical protein CM15mP93_09010 [Thiotrichaceae bacterium]|nr:MAG: hypothetical protein CM15mP93_09010 [Thiotrichaceae bacterium]
MDKKIEVIKTKTKKRKLHNLCFLNLKKLVKKIISKCTFGDIKVIFPDNTYIVCEKK